MIDTAPCRAHFDTPALKPSLVQR